MPERSAEPARPVERLDRHRLLSSIAVIAAAAIFGLTYGLSAPLIAVDLAARGAGEFLIGLNAAMHAVGVLSIAPVPATPGHALRRAASDLRRTGAQRTDPCSRFR